MLAKASHSGLDEIAPTDLSLIATYRGICKGHAGDMRDMVRMVVRGVVCVCMPLIVTFRLPPPVEKAICVPLGAPARRQRRQRGRAKAQSAPR